MSKGPVTRRRMSFAIPLDVADEIDRYPKRRGQKPLGGGGRLIRTSLASSRQGARTGAG